MSFNNILDHQLYLNLEKYIDLQAFDSLHPEICKGFTEASLLSINGSQQINVGSINPGAQGYDITPIYEVYTLWNALPDTEPLKLAGKDLTYNQLTTYLKYAFGGYDLYSRFVLFEECYESIVLGEVAKHFPNLLVWIENLKRSNVFSTIHGATLFILEAGGIPWEHHDPATTEESKKYIPEFIHIKTDLDRPFYVLDPITHNRTYIDARASWWNERNWHGGEPINRRTYTLRIDGNFSDNFKNKVVNDYA